MSILKPFVGPDGKKYGLLVQNGETGVRCYVSPRERPRHWCFKHQSWGISLEIFEELKKLKVEVIVLNVKNEGFLTATVHQFDRFGLIDNLGKEKEQIFLHDTYWHKPGDITQFFRPEEIAEAKGE